MVCRLAVMLLSLAFVSVPAAARAQDAKSPELAKQLAELLDAKKIDAFAAADAQNAGTYVALLYFPGTQLLVVSAKYSAPRMLDDLLQKKDYRGVYVELSSASITATKVFVMDTFADGLVAKPNGGTASDSVERAGTQLTFDGEWKKAKQTEADYMKAFGECDHAYGQALQLLLAKLKSTT
jgi:hypothetical protein